MHDFVDYHRKNEKSLTGYKSSGYRSAKNEQTDNDTIGPATNKLKKDKTPSQAPVKLSAEKPKLTPAQSESPTKKTGQKVGFKDDSEGEK